MPDLQEDRIVSFCPPLDCRNLAVNLRTGSVILPRKVNASDFLIIFACVQWHEAIEPLAASNILVGTEDALTIRLSVAVPQDFFEDFELFPGKVRRSQTSLLEGAEQGFVVISVKCYRVVDDVIERIEDVEVRRVRIGIVPGAKWTRLLFHERRDQGRRTTR